MDNFISENFVAMLEDCESFTDYIKKFRPSITDEIKKTVCKSKDKSLDFYLYQPLRDNILNFGKCTRPLTCLLGCALLGGDTKKALNSAIAIETFQSAALIHDDIADNAKNRRGKTCLHVTQGQNVALNAGDFALCLVDQIVLHDNALENCLKVKILSKLFEMKKNTIEGQALDLGWARDKRYDLDVNDYFFMATKKTAYYTIADPLEIGAIVAGGSDDDLKNLKEFGLKIGLAFQIQDDILNVDRASKLATKDFALDLKEGKRTLILIHALKTLNKCDRDKLLAIINEDNPCDERLNVGLELLKKSGSIKFAKSYSKDLCQEASMSLCNSFAKNCARDMLTSMCKWCIDRLD